MAEMPWSLTVDKGPPYCAKVTFWATELDAIKAAVGYVVAWLPMWHVGKVSFRAFLELVLDDKWKDAWAEAQPRIRKAAGPRISIMKIAPMTYGDTHKVVDDARKILFKPDRGHYEVEE